MLTFAGMVLMLVAAKNDAAITPLDSTKTSAVGEDETILWTYDNASDMERVEWSFKSPSKPTTTIMDKDGAAAATVYNSFNVEHVSNGSITLKAVTLDNVGIYYCTVAYTFSLGHASVTGTVTLSVIEAPIPEIYKCPGLGNSTAVDSEGECICAWIGICCAILLVVLFLIGILSGGCMFKGSCKNCVNNYFCECRCFASTPCGACCNIESLPSWYQVLWASIIGSPVAFGIWLVWRIGKGDQPGGHDQKDNNEIQMSTSDDNRM